MPFIEDASRALAIRPSLLQAGVDDRTSSHTTPPVEDTRSMAVVCSCNRDSSGNIVHACTAASYVSQATAAPQQDIAARNHDLMEVGALFDQK
ncbi:hypothetical protein COCC4DRAFT_139833 [Bipolaris maydis ATCC 48331]|uniref:Uncharacterized protein n=2 Tax=Cochliobolus heterostrophus TaxID=5016 RepID=M2TH89_COCH5|nr:uncharacterized protein COCC4DRAFT_139833 [Bipolaris maydis ATCC 48331]EMD85854.1 hypothetical protein COCHEDRAFT_1219180 [Bipolaris maydis C5]EMD92724.1 hypothetical protein COCHEDRAFT_1212557 [Bipolaris maydis C5]ENI04886.1 hypothetical protein COCC4DRAFT_139833 [Bipolaris maydis ATCC 48331]